MSPGQHWHFCILLCKIGNCFNYLFQGHILSEPFGCHSDIRNISKMQAILRQKLIQWQTFFAYWAVVDTLENRKNSALIVTLLNWRFCSTSEWWFTPLSLLWQTSILRLCYVCITAAHKPFHKNRHSNYIGTLILMRDKHFCKTSKLGWFKK